MAEIEFFHKTGDWVRVNLSYVAMKLQEGEGISDQTNYNLSDLGQWSCEVKGVGMSTWRDLGQQHPGPDTYWIRLRVDLPDSLTEKEVTLFYEDKHVMQNCFYLVDHTRS
jgi:hypothetical protein